MYRNVFPSKLIEEIITVEFFFTEDLPIGETLTSVSVTATVAQGVDPSPQSIVLVSPRVSGGRVRQWIVAGVPGVTYYLVCEATFSGSGDVVTREGYLSVIPGIGESDPFPPGYPLPLEITGAGPDGYLGAFYEYSYTVAGGIIPYTSSIIDGALPTSLTMLPTSFTANGYPTVTGEFTFTVQAEDAYGQLASVEDTIYIYGWWIAGPVYQNGEAGGSQHYYKRAPNPYDWSAPSLPLPFGKEGLERISVANGKVFMTFSSGNAVMSSDHAVTWDEADSPLSDRDVYWNGAKYFCLNERSDDGLSWEAIPGLSAAASSMIARSSDGLVVGTINDNTGGTGRFVYSYDNGDTFTEVLYPTGYGSESASILLAGSSRILWNIGAPASPSTTDQYSDDLFVNIQTSQDPYAASYFPFQACGAVVKKAFGDLAGRSPDFGFSWDTVMGSVGGTNGHFQHYGDGYWGMVSLTGVVLPGSIRQIEVAVSEDLGSTWQRDAAFLYTAAVSGNIVYTGGIGSCAAFPLADYVIFTGSDIFTGPVDNIVAASRRSWANDWLACSSDGETLVNGNVLYTRNTTSGGYDLVASGFSPSFTDARRVVISDSKEYIVRYRGSSDGATVYQRQLDGTYLSIDTVRAGTNCTVCKFIPGTDDFIVGGASDSNLWAFTVSAGIVTAGGSIDLVAGYDQIDINSAGTRAVIAGGSSTMRVFNISNYPTTITLDSTKAVNSSSDGAEGVFFSKDGSHIVSLTRHPSGGEIDKLYAWPYNTGTIGDIQLVADIPKRVWWGVMNKDRTHIAIGRDLMVDGVTAPVQVIELDETGASVISNNMIFTGYNSSGAGSSRNLIWIGK